MAARSNADWLTDLQSQGPQRDSAIADLRSTLVHGLRVAIARWGRPNRREFGGLVEDFCQEALVRILGSLESFEGRSQFTTWAQKIAINMALTELRRRRWQDISLDDVLEGVERRANQQTLAPETAAIRLGIAERLRVIMGEELTERQLLAMRAVAFGGMPLEEVARRMGTNRNALYKVLHDARVRLKRRLVREGIEGSDL